MGGGFSGMRISVDKLCVFIVAPWLRNCLILLDRCQMSRRDAEVTQVAAGDPHSKLCLGVRWCSEGVKWLRRICGPMVPCASR